MDRISSRSSSGLSFLVKKGTASALKDICLGCVLVLLRAGEETMTGLAPKEGVNADAPGLNGLNSDAEGFNALLLWSLVRGVAATCVLGFACTLSMRALSVSVSFSPLTAGGGISAFVAVGELAMLEAAF